MAALENIEYHLRNISENLVMNDKKMDKLLHPATDGTMPEVYINSSEVQRLLNASAPTVLTWIREGLITKHKNSCAPSNRYLLSEILWIKGHDYMFLSSAKLNQLIALKKKTFI